MERHCQRVDPKPITNISIGIEGLNDGSYMVEVWDTYRGAVIRTSKVSVLNGIGIPNIDYLVNDVAVKLYRID